MYNIKNILMMVFIWGAGSLLLISCDFSEEIKRHDEYVYSSFAEAVNDKLIYAIDKKTGLCFASISNNYKTLANVECTKEVLLLIYERNTNGNTE